MSRETENWVIDSHLYKIMGIRGHSIARVVKETGLSRDAVTRLYYSEGAFVHFETLIKLCRFYDCDLSDILKLVPKSESIRDTIPKRRQTTKDEDR